MSTNEFAQRVVTVLLTLLYVGATVLLALTGTVFLQGFFAGEKHIGQLAFAIISFYSGIASCAIPWGFASIANRQNRPRRVTVSLVMLGLPAAGYLACLVLLVLLELHRS